MVALRPHDEKGRADVMQRDQAAVELETTFSEVIVEKKFCERRATR